MGTNRGLVVVALCCAVLVGALLPGIVRAQGEVVGTPTAGVMGIPVTVSEIMQLEAKAPFQGPKDMEDEFQQPDRTHLMQNPASPEVSEYSEEPGLKSLPGGVQTLSPQTVGTTFTAATLSGTNPTGAYPPDCMGAVGPTQYFVFVNGRLVTFNKSTGVADGVINSSSDTFFSSVRNGSGTSDPRIRYDRLTKRWFLIIINVSTPNRILFAVSDAASAGVITGSTVFTYFYINIATTPPTISTSCLADYPTLGLDANALYIGTNDFCSSYNGTDAYVVRKSSIMSAGPIVVTAFRQLCSASGAGPFTPQGVDNYDPSSTEGYIIGVDNVSYGLLQLRRVSDPGGTPTLSANISVTVPTTGAPISVPHLGKTSYNLDALDDRLFAAHIRNGRLWTAHNIQVSSSGVYSSSGGRDGSRWYELNVPAGSGTPTLVQSGTIYDTAASSPKSYWIPSVMVSGQGHAAFAFGSAGTADRANSATVGRLSGDAGGTTGTVVLTSASSTAYNPSDANPHRWGDYSYVSLDPIDDQTMWGVHMFCNAANSYGVRVYKLIAPPPATPSALADINAGDNPVTVTLTGVSSSGSGFWDPGANITGQLPYNHLSAAITNGGATGTPPTVTSATYVGPTSVTLVLNASSATANIGSEKYTITITNPDGQTAAAAVVHVVSTSLGACCDASGGCTQTTQPNCTSPSTWNSAWTTCSPNPCPQPGACCNPSTGACTMVLQTTCVSPLTWNGGTTCSPNPCPQPGACCNPTTGACTMVLQTACTSPLTWNGGTTCSPNPCPQLGACCTSAGTCSLTLQANCASPSTWNGSWTTCSPNPCPQPGACCNPTTGACTMVLQMACTSPLTWNGISSCSPNPCPQLGACCDPATGNCTLVLQAACVSPLTWNGSTACTPNPCPQLGACCTSAGACSLTLQANCAAPATWNGSWTTCTPNPCPQPGACCNPSTGACTMVLQAACVSPLTWNGSSACTPNPCPQLGACCTSAGACSLTLQANCAAPATWNGSWTTCSPNPCPQPGACCNPSTGACTMVLQTACVSPLTWNGSSACTPNPCPQLGACCTGAGACSLTLQANCAAPATWNGSWTTCSPNPCPQPGACCATDGTCSLVLQAACASPSIWHGSWMSCSPDPCPQPGACCDPASGACGLVLQTACTSPLTWNGNPSCSPNPCPQLGACCAASGACSLVLQANCASPAIWQGANTACTPNPCPQLGACCDPATGSCSLVLQTACNFNWNGGSSCLPNPCPQLGACCSTSGACSLTLQANCTSPSIWQGANTACTPNPCPQLGACCTPGGGCSLTLHANCLSPDLWTASWTSCAPNPCSQPGACCDPANGDCSLVLQGDCTKVWNGASSCTPNPCPQLGACCSTSGACSLVLEANCFAPSNWNGSLTSCTPNPCAQPGACCDPASGACTLVLQANCSLSWNGTTSCTPNPCPQLGACCTPAGSCSLTLQAACAAPSTWNSAWSACLPNPCPLPLRACCDPVAGGCVVVLEADCAAPGVWHSDWLGCSPNPCPQPGACCLSNGQCLYLVESDCGAQQGIWGGLSTNCDPDLCPTSNVQAISQRMGEGLLGASPNPFTDATTLWYRLARAGRVRVEIFDAGGHRLRSMDLGVLGAGVHWVRWDGQSNRGMQVLPGICFARLTSGTQQWTQTLTRIQ